jgi:hypothetical protein
VLHLQSEPINDQPPPLLDGNSGQTLCNKHFSFSLGYSAPARSAIGKKITEMRAWHRIRYHHASTSHASQAFSAAQSTAPGSHTRPERALNACHRSDQANRRVNAHLPNDDIHKTAVANVTDRLSFEQRIRLMYSWISET